MFPRTAGETSTLGRGVGGGKQVSDVRNVKSGMNALARFSMKSLFSFPYVSMSDIYYLYLLKNLYRKSN